jgi:hypothetical protein
MTAIATPSELQKAEEFLALTRFREVSDQLTGTLEPVVQDPPDFLITDGSRRASVEMTRYLQRTGERGLRGRTAAYATRLAMNSDHPQVELIDSTLGPNLYEEWLDAHGEGIHHLGYYVESVADAISEMQRAGYEAVQTGIATGLDGDGGTPTSTYGRSWAFTPRRSSARSAARRQMGWSSERLSTVATSSRRYGHVGRRRPLKDPG